MKHLFLLITVFSFFTSFGSSHTNRSVLADGKWWKISVKETGIHKITWQDLKNLNIDISALDPANIRIYGNGGRMLPESNQVPRPDDLNEVAIEVCGGSDGKFDQGDYILFYATGPLGWNWNAAASSFIHSTNLYSDYSFYFITVDDGNGKRISNAVPPSSPPTNYSKAYTDYFLIEKDSLSLIKSGKSWYGDVFSVHNTTLSVPFHVPGLITGTPAKIVTSVAAKSQVNSSFYLDVNNQIMDTIKVDFVDPSSTSVFAKSKLQSTQAELPSDDFVLSYTYSLPFSDALGWLDYSEISYRRKLMMTGTQVSFRDPLTTGKNNITSFTITGNITGMRIWNVTDPAGAEEIQVSSTDSGFTFLSATDTLNEFIAFDGTFYYPVQTIGEVPNQNLHALSPSTLVIVTTPEFMIQANILADFHRNRTGISVDVVDVDQIYNEFASGKKDISAIRDFVKMLYDRGTGDQKTKYLLLIGDGSYDPKNRIPGNNDIIPTFQSVESLKPIATYVSDDFYGIMADNAGNESNGRIDIGIGRFPVTTADQAKIIVDKIINYASVNDTVMSDWRNLFTFIADDENNNLHMHQAEELVSIVENQYPSFNINKIYLDAYRMVSTPTGDRLPQVNQAINDAVAKGTLILNYTGHGGEEGWSAEKVLTIPDIQTWTNYNKLPVFITATCEFSRFDNPERITGGELVLLQPNGGAIALYSTTRQALATSNFKLDTSFFHSLIAPPGEPVRTMGDLIRISKNNNNNNYTIRNFVLLGDPAQAIAFPEYNVVTTEINGAKTGSSPDTLKGLTPVTVKGEIRTVSGDKMISFNGNIYPKMFDKATEVMTIGNTSGSYPEAFEIRNSLLYSGISSVKNGEFSFSFVIPEGVSQPMGQAKFSYYARNEDSDAGGAYFGAMTGGKDESIIPELRGPDITVYFDGMYFQDGNITTRNPLLTLYLEDPEGINYIYLGIGHEITMSVDDGPAMVMNDYFQPEKDNYGKGSLDYAFSDLAYGRHTLYLKAWDMYNNASDKMVTFFVHEQTNPLISSLSAFPNPFTDKTTFYYIPATDAGQPVVEVIVYSLSGKPVAKIPARGSVSGQSIFIEWDGRGDDGAEVPAGIYFYSLRAQGSDGNSGIYNGKIIRAAR